MVRSQTAPRLGAHAVRMSTMTQDAGLHAPVVARPATRRPFPVAACAALAGSLAVVVFWWLGTPTTVGSTPGGALTSLGELAGLLASFLVCLQLLLVGRVPWFERA